jgi:60Kd inner membrane protein
LVDLDRDAASAARDAVFGRRVGRRARHRRGDTARAQELLPISWNVALRNAVRQRKLRKLQPELERAKQRFADDRRAYAQRMLKLYRDHGVNPVDVKSLLAAFAQMPVFIGMYQTLRSLG